MMKNDVVVVWWWNHDGFC